MTSVKLDAHKFVYICVFYIAESVKYTNDKPPDLKKLLFKNPTPTTQYSADEKWWFKTLQYYKEN